MTRLTVPIYAITLILSAFLLFSVQPIFAKMILPLLGGSPSVWNIAMVFFQAMLLAGYAYAHGTSYYLTLRTQTIIHIALLLAFATFLPFGLPSDLHPVGNPAFWQIGIMLTVVGAPFFIISASAPMIQRWFSASGHPDAVNPYFLYAASNIGSMAALLSYPVIVEPGLTLNMQSIAWTGGYQILIILTAICAVLVWNKNVKDSSKDSGAVSIPVKMKLIWMGLAFIPSSLMLGVTTYITTDLASIPLLWIIPLSLYLLTFILVFARRTLVTMDYAVSLFSAFLVLLVFFESARIFDKKAIMIFMHLAVFFFASLLCHKKLADMRPAASNLTGFYMYMSLGGVLGGIFNALIAPVLFVVPLEYALVLCGVLFVRGYCFMPDRMNFSCPDFSALIRMKKTWIIAATILLVPVCFITRQPYLIIITSFIIIIAMLLLRTRPMGFALLGSFLLLTHANVTVMNDSKILDLRRNFFGVLQVNEVGDERNFLHGTTLHGSQPIDPEHRLTQLTYYNPHGPLGDLFKILDKNKAPQKIAAIGLGVGTVSCYSHKGRSFDFYEIDPDVVKIAEDKSLFTYLSDCGSPYTVTLGDGRLMLDRVPDATYDTIILDAFSSDNIPMHLLTLDAFRIYMAKVKAGGVIAINISNRFLNLEPQIAALSQETHVPAVIRYSRSGDIAEGSDLRYTASLWVVFTPNPDILIPLRQTGEWSPARLGPGHRVWTDDYANIITSLDAFSILRRGQVAQSP